MSGTQEFLPCPFCGKQPEAVIGFHAKYDVKVLCECGVEGPLFGADDFSGELGAAPYLTAAIAAWNTRVPVNRLS